MPTGLQYARVACANAPTFVTTATPTFTAETTDPVDHRPTLEFEISDSTGVPTRHEVAGAADGIPVSWTATLGRDGTYAWRVRGVTGTGTTRQVSAWSPTQRFVLDTSAPGAPVSASVDYPPDLYGGTVGKTIASTSASSTQTAAGYAFGWDVTPPSLASGTCTYASDPRARTGYQTDSTFTVPADLPPGRHTLWTSAFDGAHNASGTTAYTFYVAPTISNGSGVLPTRLEGEGLPVGRSTAATYVEFAPSASAGAQLHIVPARGTTSPVGQSVTTTFVVGVDGSYAVNALMATGPHHAKVDFILDGQPVGPTVFDGFASAPGQAWVDLGGSRLTRGTHRLTLTLRGHTATGYLDPVTGRDDQGYAVGLDLLTGSPVNGFTTTSFADALNNHGIVSTDGSTAPVGLATDLGGTPERVNLSLRALGLSGARLRRSAPVMIDGVPFQLPTPKGSARGAADNVVAMGQTIPIGPTPRVLQSVDLLVAAACGDVAPPPDVTHDYPRTTFSLNQVLPDDSVTTTPTVPTIPDLLTPASTTATHVTYPTPTDPFELATPRLVSAWRLPYADLGTTPSPTTRPWIYHVTVPVNPNFLDLPVAGLTLPDIGSTFARGTCRTSFHVLAMTPVP
ncbi:hypothetical protein V3N99_07785 [Dermatophilaceae bacterium Soc4.6]